MKLRFTIILCCLFALISIDVYGQNGACCRAAYFDIDTAPDPPVFTGIGDSHWPIHTSSDSCQMYFDQGIRQIHCYNDFEAMRAFRKAIRLDSTCAMCYWGLAYANISDQASVEVKKANLKKAWALNESNSKDFAYDLHSKLIAALIHFYDIKNANKADKIYAKELMSMMPEYGDNLEFLLVLSESCMADYDIDGEPNAAQLKLLDILRHARQIAPQSVAAEHYWIHATEAGKYLDSARYAADRLPSMAPGSPHIVHMPGHIYFRTGEYSRADSAFYRAFIADSIYMSTYHISSYNDWNYVHNLDFMIHNKVEMGDLPGAVYWIAKLNAVPVLENCPNSGVNNSNYGFLIYSMLAPLRTHDWSIAADNARTLQAYVDSAGISEKHPSLMLIAGYIEIYARFAAALDIGNSEVAANLALQSDQFVRMKVNRNKRIYKDDDLYDFLSTVIKVYNVHAVAYMRERSGSPRSADKAFKYAIDHELQSWQSEPPYLFSSPVEWMVEYYIRAGRIDEASAVAGKYALRRASSPYVVYYQALIAEQRGDAGYKDILRQSLALFADQNAGLAQHIRVLIQR